MATDPPAPRNGGVSVTRGTVMAKRPNRHVADDAGLSLNPASLVHIRVLAGFSQAELARRSGLSQGHISELERGDKQARPGTIKKLAVALFVPMPALLDNNCSDHEHAENSDQRQEMP